MPWRMVGAPMAGLGITMFVIPRLLKTPLIGARYALAGAVLWNVFLITGLGSIRSVSAKTHVRWLEIPCKLT